MNGMKILMNCPKCTTQLVHKSYKGMMEVECCPNCRGMWLDSDELDRLEDVAFSKDSLKGSLIHRETATSLPCPHCGKPLFEFQYRLYSLKLDLCIEENHGFWLDAGEDERVLEIMRQRSSEMSRKHEVESEWRMMLKEMHEIFKQSK
jgi:Zn-finger nucleic acid-binding protein